MPPAVDLDDITNWPDRFRAVVEQYAADAEPDPWYTGEDERIAIRALSGHLVRVYHCTRLTPTELKDVRSVGLRPLTPDFTSTRIEQAVSDGHLSGLEGNLYRQTSLPRDKARANKIWMLSHRRTLSDAGQVGYLLEIWGGEGINRAFSSRSAESKRLEAIGTPTVIIALLDLDLHYVRGGPGILTSSVNELRSRSGGTTVQASVTIEPEYIENIHHPSGSFWKQHVWTPEGGFSLPHGLGESP